MTAAPGVVVMGTGRSGTSLVAGLLAAHGVFFGRCKPGDQHNPRGYWEHVSIASPGIIPGDWPERWPGILRSDGWDGVSPWGVKHMAGRWRYFRRLAPAVILLTARPVADVVASIRRTGWDMDPAHVVRLYRRRLRRIRREARCPIITVSTPALVAGRSQEFAAVLSLLGLAYRPELAREWIDPRVWHGRTA